MCGCWFKCVALAAPIQSENYSRSVRVDLPKLQTIICISKSWQNIQMESASTAMFTAVKCCNTIKCPCCNFCEVTFSWYIERFKLVTVIVLVFSCTTILFSLFKGRLWYYAMFKHNIMLYECTVIHVCIMQSRTVMHIHVKY